jgi:hypothetical protein
MWGDASRAVATLELREERAVSRAGGSGGAKKRRDAAGEGRGRAAAVGVPGGAGGPGFV